MSLNDPFHIRDTLFRSIAVFLEASSQGTDKLDGLQRVKTRVEEIIRVANLQIREQCAYDVTHERQNISGIERLGKPGINYLESLHKDNVKVVYGEIESITEKGCKCDDGNEYPVDVLICATGFDTSFRPRFPLIGPGNVNLQDAWAKEPKSYLGVAAPGFPNYFIFLGPNCPIGNGPVLSAIETQADYMLTLVD
ncbi:hypothetical protein B0A49_08048, partial [Cryomyces minteri]